MTTNPVTIAEARIRDLTDDQYEALAAVVEDHVNGIPCPECGRSDDWLLDELDGKFYYLRCDDCGGTCIRVPLSKINPVVEV